jgi:hypothetical protein
MVVGKVGVMLGDGEAVGVCDGLCDAGVVVTGLVGGADD